MTPTGLPKRPTPAPPFLKTISFGTALVNVGLLMTVVKLCAASREVRARGSRGERTSRTGKRDANTSPALLGLLIDAFIRRAARLFLPYEMPVSIGRKLAISRQVRSRALQWLAAQGVKRAPGTFGIWSVALPHSMVEIRQKFVPVSEAALFLSPRAFFVLALLHYIGEEQLRGAKDDREYVIAHREYVSLKVLTDFGLGERFLASALPELVAREFIAAPRNGVVHLTPHLGQPAMMERRGIESRKLQSLYKTHSGATVDHYRQLRGEPPLTEREISARRANKLRRNVMTVDVAASDDEGNSPANSTRVISHLPSAVSVSSPVPPLSTPELPPPESPSLSSSSFSGLHTYGEPEPQDAEGDPELRPPTHPDNCHRKRDACRRKGPPPSPEAERKANAASPEARNGVTGSVPALLNYKPPVEG